MTSLAERLTDWIERNEKLDAAAGPARAFWSAALKPQKLRTVLSGTPIGHPLHPALVLVPAGSLLSASVLDAVGEAAAARRLVGIGLLSSVPTIAAGWSDWLDTHGAEQRVGIVHAAANALGLTAYAVSWVQRRSGGGRVAGFTGAALLGAGGWLGGHLAYAQGVGVDTTAFQAGPDAWTDVAAATDITTALTRLDVDGVGLLATRIDGRPVVLADRCTHRGAPLSDGDRSGNCVVCPWHGSEFSLADGSVRKGPATRPQPAYEAKLDGGRLWVRRVEPRSLRTNPA